MTVDKDIGELVSLYERFIDAVEAGLGAEGRMDVRVFDRLEVTEQHRAAIERRVGEVLPDDLATFLRARPRSIEIGDEEGYPIAGEKFASGGWIASQIESSVAIANAFPPDHSDEDEKEQQRLLRKGIPFLRWRDYLLVDPEPGPRTGVRAMHLRVPPRGDALSPVAASFTEWLAHFVASGCFNDRKGKLERFADYWEVVGPYVPLKIPAEQNRWLRFLMRW